MKNFNPSKFHVTVQQININSGRTIFRNAELVLEHYNSELVIDFNITSEECFDKSDDSYYQLSIYYDIDNLANLWSIKLKVNDLECNDFFLEKDSSYISLQQFIQNHILQNKLLEKLKEKPSVKQKKI